MLVTQQAMLALRTHLQLVFHQQLQLLQLLQVQQLQVQQWVV
jgi:hypothetical protein